MKVKPMDDRVLIEPVEEESKTPSGIIIPDTAKEKPIVGKVLAVGTDEDLRENIKEGDRVLFAKYGGEDITVDGKDLKIIQRSDILAIIED
ncbi:co-chaperonin GroES [Melioribacter roseus P3M-2]|uniref:Co-chaperonin GroES n=1 Tax=Melioribacter roseus (strain DSM 23840 / JCM 17771 / VKM B-2668 / P3M-2) TaxID=1191523 RepID=I7A0R3_MELRP|nr:co-chaperone GroES [Melioribacter roseus]AFN74833.1 co-chaperonin GroES [Melioribacter roseus P3M-2]